MHSKRKQSGLDSKESGVSFEKQAAGSYKRLYRAAWYFTGNHEDASDLVQETFAQACKSYSGYKGISSFYTWLYAIFRNVKFEAARKKKLFITRKGYLQEMEEEEFQFSAPDTPLTLLVRSEACFAVHNAIKILPEKYREVLLLRHFEGFSYSEIADIANCSVGTVKSRIFKARKLLKKLLR